MGCVLTIGFGRYSLDEAMVGSGIMRDAAGYRQTAIEAGQHATLPCLVQDAYCVTWQPLSATFM
jgi:hypothetical protein